MPAHNLSTSINPIVFRQENRSFDHYRRCANTGPERISHQSFDGLPHRSEPHRCRRSSVPVVICTPAPRLRFDASPVPFHLLTQCVENPSPSWNETMLIGISATGLYPPAALDGFVFTAGTTPAPLNRRSMTPTVRA
jgi:hypothetical protein